MIIVTGGAGFIGSNLVKGLNAFVGLVIGLIILAPIGYTKYSIKIINSMLLNLNITQI